MSTNVRAFALDLNKFNKDLTEQQLGTLVRKVALQVLSGVVFSTPVDTGRARGNWQVSLDRPATGSLNLLDKQGRTVVSTGSVTIGRAPVFGHIWVTNNLPYIERLEYGHSKQAPAGMLLVTMAEVEAQFS